MLSTASDMVEVNSNVPMVTTTLLMEDSPPLAVPVSREATLDRMIARTGTSQLSGRSTMFPVCLLDAARGLIPRDSANVSTTTPWILLRLSVPPPVEFTCTAMLPPRLIRNLWPTSVTRSASCSPSVTPSASPTASMTFLAQLLPILYHLLPRSPATGKR